MCIRVRFSSVAQAVIDELRVLAGDEFPAEGGEPPERGARRLQAGLDRLDADAGDAALEDAAERPQSAPRLVGRGDDDERTVAAGLGVRAQAHGLVEGARDRLRD